MGETGAASLYSEIKPSLKILGRFEVAMTKTDSCYGKFFKRLEVTIDIIIDVVRNLSEGYYRNIIMNVIVSCNVFF